MAKAGDFSVIVGDFNDGFVEAVAETVTEALDSRQRLRVSGTPEADRILAMADEGSTDLFVLFLNNVTFGRWGRELEADSFVKALMLVRHLKAVYHSPVIATAAFPAEFLYEDIAIRLGADCFFRMPFDLKDFKKAVRELFPDRARPAEDIRTVPAPAFRGRSQGFRA